MSRRKNSAKPSGAVPAEPECGGHRRGRHQPFRRGARQTVRSSRYKSYAAYHSGLVPSGRVAFGVRCGNGGHGVHRRVLDTAVRVAGHNTSTAVIISWLSVSTTIAALCPLKRRRLLLCITGGRVISSKTKPSANRAAAAWRSSGSCTDNSISSGPCVPGPAPRTHLPLTPSLMLTPSSAPTTPGPCSPHP